MLRYASLVRRLDAPASYAWDVHADAARRLARDEDVIVLSIGDPEFATPAPVVDKTVESLRAGRTAYGPFSAEPALREAIGARARVILLNTPHNPTGEVMTREELVALAHRRQERP